VREKGLIHVYYGEGKGKTTAALGLLLRAVGHGMRVLFVQFFKHQLTGEIASLQLLPGVMVYRFGSGRFVKNNTVDEEEKREFLQGWQIVQEGLRGETYDMVILDEFPYAFFYHLLSWEQFSQLLALRNPRIELIITARKVPQELLAIADLVSEMRCVKHPFSQGTPARKGVEY